MRTCVLSLFLVFITAFCFGQGAGKDAVVAATNLNILYMGISNPVQIAVPGIPSERVTANITNGSIVKTKDGWEVNPASLSDVIITVIADNIKITDKIFRVKPLPVPVASLNGISNGTIPGSSVSKSASIKVVMNDFLWDIPYEIKSFTLAYNKNGKDFEIVSRSSLLTDEMKSVLAGLSRGQTIIFKDIKAQGPNGIISYLNPLILKID